MTRAETTIETLDTYAQCIQRFQVLNFFHGFFSQQELSAQN